MADVRSRRVRLLSHVESASTALEIGVEVERRATGLALTYSVSGDTKCMLLPKKKRPARVDGLWQHTCFEAFLCNAQPAAYWEFNFSPSREWAAYRFNGYREGMAAEAAVSDPHIEVLLNDHELRLSASLDLSNMALVEGGDWRVGLSAIIEEQNGGKSWWALAHPPGKPDFHHDESFALCLPPAASLLR